MKKIFLVAGLVLAGMTANAQFYVGGSLGVGMNSEKDGDGKKLFSSMSFGIAPEVGYNLSDKMDVGLSFAFGLYSQKDYVPGTSTNTETKGSMWGIEPYVRYSFLKFGKFDILGKLSLGIGGTKGWDIDNNGDFVLTGDEKSTAFILDINIVPLLMYNISDNFSLYTQLNFLDIGFTGITAKYDGDKQGSASTFRLGVDTDDVTTLGDVQIGFVYKF